MNIQFSPLGSRSLFLVCVSAERGIDVGMSAVLAPCVAVTVETLTSLTSCEVSLLIGDSLAGMMICRSTCSTFSSPCLAVWVPGIVNGNGNLRRNRRVVVTKPQTRLTVFAMIQIASKTTQKDTGTQVNNYLMIMFVANTAFGSPVA